MLITITLAALLSHTPSSQATQASQHKGSVEMSKSIAVDLHPMSEEERTIYPGRERFDKIEWYESQLKGVKVVLIPNQVDEWNNQGRDFA